MDDLSTEQIEVSIIIPIYNEEKSIFDFFQKMNDLNGLGQIIIKRIG